MSEGLTAADPKARWLEGPADDATLAELVETDVDLVALPLHGARADVHEWVAERAGADDESFSATLRTLDATRGLGLTRAVWTLLTRSNARVLAEMPSLLKAHRIALWILEVPEPTSTPWTQLVPRFGLSIPSALAAMERARKLGIEARIRGAPRCVLGRFSDRALPSPTRSFASVCGGCPARAHCPGVAPTYLERFGPRELRPSPALSPPPSALFSRLNPDPEGST